MLVKRHSRLAYPIVDLLASFHRQGGESQATHFLCLIHPRQFAAGVDPTIVLQQRETDSPVLFDRSNGVKAKSLPGHIQDNATVIRFDVDGGEPLHRRTRGLAAFWPQHTFSS